MNFPRFLLVAAWIVSVVIAYVIGGSGEAGRGSGAAEAQSPHAAAAKPLEPAAEHVALRIEEARTKARPTAQSVIAQARLELGSGMGGMMNMRGMLRAIAPIAELDDSELQEALAEVERTVRDSQQKMMFYSLLLGQWAETDGRAAMNYAQTKLEKNPMLEMGAMSALLGTWARKDPEAVWKWMETQQEAGANDRTRLMTVSSVFAGLAANNLETAISRLGTLDEQSRGPALNGIAMSITNDGARRRLLERTASLPAEQRDQLRTASVGQWVISNPEDAVAWIRTLPGEEQKPVRDAAAQMMLMMKPALGADFMLEEREAKDKPQLYNRVVSQWASQDARAAGEWLTKQPQGPELDPARQTFARIVVQRDPAAAMDWARSVQNQQQRTETVSQIYQLWLAKDAPAAQAALGASGLPPEKIQAIQALQAISPASTKQ